MNRLLSSMLGVLNSLLAIVIILVGVLTGTQAGVGEGRETLYAIVGGLIGLIVASVMCGLVATFIEMRDALRGILAELEGHRD